MCIAPAPAKAVEPDTPTFLLFAGTDVWRYGAFAYGGALWSPDGLDADGLTFKMLLNGGGYTYTSGTLQRSVDGTMLSAAAMPGWRFSRDGLEVRVYTGPIMQDFRLSP
jgi:hypothetical protein